ncbi:hypothetical protein GUY60_04120 [Streptomyces sp. YC537]|uniref:Uncharacterized protein n=2 Tax=Streptomyces boluensis TaxID=1775135 RepID=A0A964UMR7_9ACTN|nr:hypothetical protein [Streptomyces boluensis]
MVRLLPWATPDGKPCFLTSDDADSYVNKVADNIESIQLAMGSDLLDHAADLLADRKATPDQLHFLLARMTEALSDALRVAESRGDRLPEPDEERALPNDRERENNASLTDR